MTNDFFFNSYKKYWKKPGTCFDAKKDYFDMEKDPTINNIYIVSIICKKYSENKKTFRYWIDKWKNDISSQINC